MILNALHSKKSYTLLGTIIGVGLVFFCFVSSVYAQPAPPVDTSTSQPPTSFPNTPPPGTSQDFFPDAPTDIDSADPAETGNTDSATGNGSGAGQTETPADTTGKETWEDTVKKFIYQMFIGVGGLITWIGGNMLDWAIEELVLNFGVLLTQNLGVAVDYIWTIVRDLMNIGFIFILIWIGLRTILWADDSGWKRNLSTLIIAALLINFSLFFTKAVVDFSNIAAVQISQGFAVVGVDGNGTAYNVQGGPFGGVSVTETDRIDTSGPKTEIAAAFMESTKLSSYAASLVVAQESIGFVIAFSFVVFAMMVVAGFVFLAGAILLVVRFVTLTLVMMFSPLMFLGMMYPGLSSISSKWANIFIKNAFIAPAYLFMLYIALAIVSNGAGGFGFNNGAFANATAGDANSFGIFLHFAVVIGFLLAAVKVSDLMGAAGANVAMKVGGYGTKFVARSAGASTFGLAARGGRATIGQSAKYLGDRKWVKNLSSKSPYVGKKVQQGLSKVADSSFDARKPLKINKGDAYGFDVGLGDGRKGGVTSIAKERAKEDAKFNEWLGKDEEAGEAAEARTQYLVDAAKSDLKDVRNEKRAATQTERNRIKQLNENLKTATGEEKDKIVNEINALQATIQLKNEEFDDIVKQAEAQVEQAEKTQANAKIRALYQRQRTYRKILDQRAEFYSKAAGYAGLGVAAGTVALAPAVFGVGVLGSAALGAGAGAGIVAAGASKQYAGVNESQRKALEKEYGYDKETGIVGGKKEKNDKKKNTLKELAKELDDAEEGKKKDDKE